MILNEVKVITYLWHLRNCSRVDGQTSKSPVCATWQRPMTGLKWGFLYPQLQDPPPLVPSADQLCHHCLVLWEAEGPEVSTLGISYLTKNSLCSSYLWHDDTSDSLMKCIGLIRASRLVRAAAFQRDIEGKELPSGIKAVTCTWLNRTEELFSAFHIGRLSFSCPLNMTWL